jgi:XTP/dITP diphosphohydrolase
VSEPVVLLATGNLGKAGEFRRLLSGTLEVRALAPTVALPEETGRTFAENARLKAETVFAALGEETAVLADDSGLEVAALGGRPGILSARFAGEGAGDEANVNKLLRELYGRGDREARFICSLCLALPEGWRSQGRPLLEETGGDAIARVVPQLLEVAGISTGTITTDPRGTDGFGYDPIFEPTGWSITLAEASPEAKDLISHRGAAARALVDRLVELGLVDRGS